MKLEWQGLVYSSGEDIKITREDMGIVWGLLVFALLWLFSWLVIFYYLYLIS